ncbi:hypothetical protein D3C81_2054820 [compost metagenome]
MHHPPDRPVIEFQAALGKVGQGFDLLAVVRLAAPEQRLALFTEVAVTLHPAPAFVGETQAQRVVMLLDPAQCLLERIEVQRLARAQQQ